MTISLHSVITSCIHKLTHPLQALSLICTLSFAFVFFSTASLGQTDKLPLDTWKSTSESVVQALERDDVSTELLESYRSQLSDQRAAALDAQSGLRFRLETLEAEQAALGPVPDEGTTESTELLQRRIELAERVAEAKVPLIDAESAYQRADGLIREIDSVIRGRLSDRLTSLGPSPFNPVVYKDAVSEISDKVKLQQSSFAAFWNSDRERSLWWRSIPVPALMMLVGFGILTYVGPTVMRLARRALTDTSSSGQQAVWGAVLNLARIVIPAFAAATIYFGIAGMTPSGLRRTGILEAIPSIAVTLIAAHWLSHSVFSPKRPELALISLQENYAWRGRRLGLLLGLTLSLVFLFRQSAAVVELTDSVSAVVLFPLILIGSLFLARLSSIMRKTKQVVDEEDKPTKTSTTVLIDFITRACFIVAIFSPILAAFGYLQAAISLFLPTVLTLAVVGALAIVFALFRDSLESWLQSGDEASRKSRSQFRLIPVFVGFILICLAVPVIALIWGARPSDLQEVWVWLRDGISVGEVRLSVTDVLVFVLVFGIGYTITRMAQSMIQTSVLPRTSLDKGASNAIVSGIGYVGIFIAAMIAISSTGLSLSNIAIVAGALSVGVGFGLQTIVSNFVSGIILLIERPIKQGDWIEVANYSGFVQKISVRSTMIETFDRASVIVPNSELVAGTVLNWTHSEMIGRVIVPVGVAYGSDPRKVEEVLMEVAESHPMVLRRPAPAVVFQGFGADSMDFEIRAFLRDVTWMLSAKSDMNYAILKTFEENGIEIPYAQRDINLRNVDEAAKAFWAGKKATDN